MSNAQTEKPVSIAERFATQTSKAGDILQLLAASIVDMTGRVKDLAIVAVDVRAAIEREVASKKTGKTVTVPDWDGRSPAYREWYREVFTPLMEKTIPADFHGTLRTRLQNQIQEEAHRRATPAQKAHLGMAARSKAQGQNEKRQQEKNAQQNGANEQRQSEETFATDALTEHVSNDSVSLTEVAESILAMTRAFEKRTRNADVSGAERTRLDKLTKQCIDAMIAARSHVKTASESREKVAA